MIMIIDYIQSENTWFLGLESSSLSAFLPTAVQYPNVVVTLLKHRRWSFQSFLRFHCPLCYVLWPALRSILQGLQGQVVWFVSSPTPFLPLNPPESCLFFSVFLCVAGRAYWPEGGGGRGWGRSQSIRRRESLVLVYSILSATCPLVTSNRNKDSSVNCMDKYFSSF